MKFSLPVRNALLLASIGIVITLLVGYVLKNTHDTYNRNLPYVKLGDYLKNTVTKAHLWFEEAMAGDASIDYEKDVKKLLADSKGLLQSALDGKETSLGKFWPTNDEETMAIMKEAIIGIEGLMESADQRWEARHQSSSSEPAFTDSTMSTTESSMGDHAGSALDQQFDASYEGLQTTFDKLVVHVSKNVSADSRFLVVLSWLSEILILGIFTFLCLFVFRMLRRNEKLVEEGKAKLEEETKRVSTLSSFIEAVSSGNYAISIDSTDELSMKLITMRDTLSKNAEEDKQRNWATSGLAQIGEILRNSGSSTTELYDNIIKFVVKYTNSNQGGLFLLNDDNEHDHYLELVSCYAFERKKFIQKRVDPGQGLVGQCFMEGARIYLLEIPEEYVNITSGLGGSNPNALLIVPMKVNEKIYGVIELASFHKYEEHEIVLVEKFADSIGAAVSSVKINESTRILLEKTQQQAEEMRSQEEEMRQNMEELSATQEEMVRKEREYINRIKELEAKTGNLV